MHYVYIVAVPDGSNLDDILAPYEVGSDKTAPNSKNPEHLAWDWWVNGGRWTGRFFNDEEDSGVKSQLTDRVPYGFIDEFGVPWCHEPFWHDGPNSHFVKDEEFEAKWLAFLIRIPDDMKLVCIDIHN